ncbi:hypothetical protein PSQ19_10535 [Devosia algicola]|uniref:Ricin B lectin domain-containing protein n=1 Tax=Devosia algicola TaxID=3026418 RepID=A0ABY7YIZ7_9HYPH|nr:hypothetical protein [Devosia algicola]WDR01283.1 hypothetical protein PSQ19_10535 [Devosia algicola]
MVAPKPAFLQSVSAPILVASALAISQIAPASAANISQLLSPSNLRPSAASPALLTSKVGATTARLLVAQNAQQPTLTVDNTTGYPVDVLYTDQGGNYVLYQTMQTGTRLLLQGQTNFVWYFGIGNSAIIGNRQMSADPAQYLLLDENILAQAGIGGAPAQAAQPPQPAPAQQQAIEPQITIDNTTGVDVDVLYVDQSGNFVPYQLLASGNRLILPSQAGFIWYFGVGGQTIVAQYQTTQQPDQYFVLDENLVSAALQTAPTAPAAQTNAVQQAQQAQQAQLQRPLPTAPAVSDPTMLPAGPRADVPIPQSTNQGQALVPFRPDWVRDTWELGQKDMRLISTLKSGRSLFTDQNGQVGASGLDTATSAANWYLEPTGNRGEYLFRSARETKKYLYIDPDSVSGSPVLFGETDLNAPTAHWRVSDADIGANLIVNVARPDLMMFENNGTVEMRPTKTARAATVNDIWYVDTVADWLSLRGIVSALGENIEQAEQDYAALQAQHDAEQAASEEADRIALLAHPYSATDPNDPGYFWVHPAQGPVDASNPAGKGITYTFDRVSMPDIMQTLLDFDTSRTQSVHLNFKPEIYAFVNNGVAYVRMKTGGVTGIEPTVEWYA